jgi:hypothetical protein
MKERGVIMTGHSVNQILADLKTASRRIMKPQPVEGPPEHFYAVCKKLDAGYCHTTREAMVRLLLPHCPYGQIGDHLFVREKLHRGDDGCWLRSADNSEVTLPRGDPRGASMIAWAHHKEQDYCSPLHMPRFACRLTLEITGVRIARIQETSEADARAEGAVPGPSSFGVYPSAQAARAPETYTAAFRRVWCEINGAKSWDANDWVWVLGFKRIDAKAEAGDGRNDARAEVR